MTRPHRVLVTAVGGNIGQGVVKALRAASREFVIVGTDMEPASAGFSMVDKACVIPAASHPSAESSIVRLVQQEQVEAVFVSSPAELAFFTRARATIERETGAAILLNPPEVIRIGQDKLATSRFLEASGFPFPETASVDDPAAVKALLARWGFPVIAKPRAGASSQNVFRVSSEAELRAVQVLVPDLIVQQYLPDDEGEFTVGVVGRASEATFVWIGLRRDLIQGTTYRTHLAQDPVIGAAVVAMAQRLGVEGNCNFQLRMVGGQPVVFEINPRFSGTCGIRYLYGFNDVDLTFAYMCLGEAPAPPLLQDVLVMRYWNEVSASETARTPLPAGGPVVGEGVPFPARSHP